MSESLVCTFTNVGLRALRNAQNTGLQATISHLAVGRGEPSGQGFVGYTPARTDVALRSETVRVPLLTGVALDSTAGFRVLAVVPASSLPEEYWIQEVAAILADGTVLAIWSDPEHPLSGKTATTDVDLAYDLILDGMPANLLKIAVTEPDIPDTTAVLFEQIAFQARMFSQVLAITERLGAAGL